MIFRMPQGEESVCLRTALGDRERWPVGIWTSNGQEEVREERKSDWQQRWLQEPNLWPQDTLDLKRTLQWEVGGIR